MIPAITTGIGYRKVVVCQNCNTELKFTTRSRCLQAIWNITAPAVLVWLLRQYGIHRHPTEAALVVWPIWIALSRWVIRFRVKEDEFTLLKLSQQDPQGS